MDESSRFDSGAEAVSSAWRCAACGRLYLFQQHLAKPAACPACGSPKLEPVSPTSTM